MVPKTGRFLKETMWNARNGRKSLTELWLSHLYTHVGNLRTSLSLCFLIYKVVMMIPMSWGYYVDRGNGHKKTITIFGS